MRKIGTLLAILVFIFAGINFIKVKFPDTVNSITNAFTSAKEYTVVEDDKLTGTPVLNAAACISGSNTWGEEIAVSAGDTVEFKLEFQNNCSGMLENVRVGGDLGEILEYNPESASVRSIVYPEGIAPTETIDSETGITIGNPLGFTDVDLRNHRGANAFISFSCTIPAEVQSGQHVITFWAKADNWETIVTAPIAIHIQST